MAVSIYVPTALRNFTGGNESVAVEAGTVADALGALIDKHPNLKKHLYNDQGELRHFVNIYVNDEDIRYLDKGETKLKDGARLGTWLWLVVAWAATEGRAAMAVGWRKEKILRNSRNLICRKVAL